MPPQINVFCAILYATHAFKQEFKSVFLAKGLLVSTTRLALANAQKGYTVPLISVSSAISLAFHAKVLEDLHALLVKVN